MKRILITLVIITMIGVGTLPAMANAPEVCSQGGDWSSHQDPPLSSVENAVEYCVKGGNSQSQGCDGYLVRGSFQTVSNAINQEGVCGLSHWSYRLGNPTSTPVTPTKTQETPTATHTLDPEETPTATPEITNTPTEVTITPRITNTPQTTPTVTPELPRTGVALMEDGGASPTGSVLWIPSIGVNNAVVNAPVSRQAEWDISEIGISPALLEGTNTIVGHVSVANSDVEVPFSNLGNLDIGDSAYYNGDIYRVTSVGYYKAHSFHVIDSADLVLITCVGYVESGDYWSHRIVVQLDLYE